MHVVLQLMDLGLGHQLSLYFSYNLFYLTLDLLLLPEVGKVVIAALVHFHKVALCLSLEALKIQACLEETLKFAFNTLD